MKLNFIGCWQILNEFQQKTECLQEEKRQLQQELQMKQRLYVANIKLLQEAENMLQYKSTLKHEVSLFFYFCAS